ncbi:MAG: YebC/PmpR family DNA-binding transcriptional regulator, partial [Candidatus Magasanikbacteria bacterium CG10_big_fil_rev_8_21_14_0_10_43_6]
MSGHSKWSKIQHKKGRTDKARSNLFTKLLRSVTLAAQEGGMDPDMNFSLRLAVEKAKAGNVPKDNIDRAIKKGGGAAKDGVVFEEVVYEGFGPHGVALIIEALTDNKNRTVSEIKHLLAKSGGSLAGPGSVQWQ